jgi:hypothetical protein
MTDFARKSLLVSTLDTARATELVQKVLGRDFPEGDFSRYKAQPMAVVNTEKGLATICTEGVGWHADSNGLYTIGYFRDFGEGWIDVTLSDVVSCISKEQVDLAQFIRNHNDRLQMNYELWFWSASKIPQVF